MKKVISYKRLEISLVKGFMFGFGFDNDYVFFIGPVMIELLQKPPVRKHAGIEL